MKYIDLYYTRLLVQQLHTKPFLHRDKQSLEEGLEVVRSAFVIITHMLHQQAAYYFCWNIVQHFVRTLQLLPSKNPILFKLGGDFLQFCPNKQAFVRIPDIPDDLPEQLAAALQALDGIGKGDAMNTCMSLRQLSGYAVLHGV